MIRVIGAIVALVLTIGGAVALSLYVGSAETRAQNGAKLQQVYVVADEIIPRGTPAEDIITRIKVVEIPAIAVQAGPVTDINSLAGRVATADLLPGEQLVVARFAKPETLNQAVAVPVPKGLSEVTIALPVEQAVGGEIKPGDYLGLVATTQFQDDQAVPFPVTKSAIHKLLVTRVSLGDTYQPQNAASQGQTQDQGQAQPKEPVRMLLITVAATTPQAEQIVYLAEMGKRKPIGIDGAANLITLWGIRETKDSKTDESVMRTLENLFK